MRIEILNGTRKTKDLEMDVFRQGGRLPDIHGPVLGDLRKC
jgi:hypothetical protein